MKDHASLSRLVNMHVAKRGATSVTMNIKLYCRYTTLQGQKVNIHVQLFVYVLLVAKVLA